MHQSYIWRIFYLMIGRRKNSTIKSPPLSSLSHGWPLYISNSRSRIISSAVPSAPQVFQNFVSCYGVAAPKVDSESPCFHFYIRASQPDPLADPQTRRLASQVIWLCFYSDPQVDLSKPLASFHTFRLAFRAFWLTSTVILTLEQASENCRTWLSSTRNGNKLSRFADWPTWATGQYRTLISAYSIIREETDKLEESFWVS